MASQNQSKIRCLINDTSREHEESKLEGGHGPVFIEFP